MPKTAYLTKDDVTYESLDDPEVQRIYKKESYFSYRVKKYDND